MTHRIHEARARVKAIKEALPGRPMTPQENRNTIKEFLDAAELICAEFLDNHPPTPGTVLSRVQARDGDYAEVTFVGEDGKPKTRKEPT